MLRDKLLQAPALDDEFHSHLRLVEPDDAAFICELRSDPSLNKHLSKSSASVADQRAWIERYKEREAAGEEFYFIIMSNGQNSGVVRLYDFRDGPRSASWGSWILKQPSPRHLATFTAMLIYETAFEHLGFEQSHFEVRKENEKVIAFHLRTGAEQVSETEIDRHFVFRNEKWPAFKEASMHQFKAHRFFAG